MSSILVTIPIEERIKRDRGWSMDEGDRHFRGRGLVFETLRKITARLEDIGVPYAVAGALAMDAHGLRRLTVGVDILVERAGLDALHHAVVGLGYVPLFAGSKSLRDVEHGVRIEFLIAGDFPGDGKPKPIAFPRPDDASIVLEGIRFLTLPRLVELKLASGMTGGIPRLKDLADVVELVKTLDLPGAFAAELHPFVREKYLELWTGIRDSPPGPLES